MLIAQGSTVNIAFLATDASFPQGVPSVGPFDVFVFVNGTLATTLSGVVLTELTTGVYTFTVGPPATNTLGQFGFYAIAQDLSDTALNAVGSNFDSQVVIPAFINPTPTGSPPQNQGQFIPVSTAFNRVFYAGATGLAFTAILSKNGTGFVPAAGSVSPIAGGWYNLALTATDTNTVGPLAIILTAGATILNISDQVYTPTATPPPATIPPENQGQLIPVGTAFNRAFFAGATGLAFTAFLSKNGGPFAGATGTVTEIGNGWYNLAYTAADTNTLGTLAVMLTSTSVTVDFSDQVTALPINSPTAPTAIQRNTAVAAVPFPMYSPGPPSALLPGLAVSGQRSLDGGAFVTLAGPITEIGNGWYSTPLTAAETNGAMIALRFSAAGAQDTLITIATQVG